MATSELRLSPGVPWFRSSGVAGAGVFSSDSGLPSPGNQMSSSLRSILSHLLSLHEENHSPTVFSGTPALLIVPDSQCPGIRTTCLSGSNYFSRVLPLMDEASREQGIILRAFQCTRKKFHLLVECSIQLLH